jgi:para-aminobenzoate synthetase component 1
MTEFEPLVHELTPPPDVESALVRFASRPGCVFFDSSLRHATLGRYSFLATDPVETLQMPVTAADSALVALKAKLDRLAAFATTHLAELPPFQGGAAILLSYDLHRALEKVSPPRHDEFTLPLSSLGMYDVVLAFDHLAHRAWLISQGYPETELGVRARRAAARLAEFAKLLTEPARPRVVPQQIPIPATDLAPQFTVPRLSGVTSNFSRDAYRGAVERAIEYIYAGDVFQVNLSQRLLSPALDDSLELYLRLRNRNPATFSAYYDLGDAQIVSASPERFFTMRSGQVETRPIKGTRSRSHWPEADLFRGDELLASEKDRAENVMIVDLLRNDLSRVCTPESVRVTQLCSLETYQYVQHLVSAVEGQLKWGLSAFDVLAAAFPGGSITGAPKIRAMQIIAELEPTARGAYCGSLGYVSFGGNSDFNILIRTITAAGQWLQLPVGGGIVAQSQPEAEYQETWHKAEGMLRSLQP